MYFKCHEYLSLKNKTGKTKDSLKKLGRGGWGGLCPHQSYVLKFS